MKEQNAALATGRLSLVSVGVGDVDNITVKALKTIESAHVVFGMGFIVKQYGHLLEGKEVHDSGHASFLGMSSTAGPRPPTREEELTAIAIIRDAVAAGKNVVVLDFGDPTLYSPQAGYLVEFADLQPEVVPGISSFNAANAVLRKELSGNFDRPVVITHAMAGRDDGDHLETLAAAGATLVFFTMGMDLKRVTETLKRRLPRDTPAVIVRQAGFERKQTAISATLDTIVAKVDGASLPWAYLLYVGEALK
ncbi:SAM-dependent methyltransferase [Xanthobacteraceae bacterium Astr-EGSB]|uniref:SAM-dependent methyltransferase n=1 Tax=Astrobacterium formosum TaxID=3069710 RepID=UPI0027AE0821|nr:SAM-dependent methyltransferase [Xanthobacteraceae bacterium Astr-EGSB]